MSSVVPHPAADSPYIPAVMRGGMLVVIAGDKYENDVRARSARLDAGGRPDGWRFAHVCRAEAASGLHQVLVAFDALSAANRKSIPDQVRDRLSPENAIVRFEGYSPGLLRFHHVPPAGQ